MANTRKVADRLAARAAAPTPVSRTIYSLLEEVKPQLGRALPATMTADRFARVVLTEVRRTPRLLECTPESFLGAVLLSAQLGLEPGPLGHAYYVPFRDTRRGVTECQFILGYKGFIDLARRSGNVASIVAREVCANDEFDFEYGLDERLTHRPALNGRGDVVAVYAVARYVDGGHSMIVMSREDIEERRKRSRAKDSGPWVTDWAAMARKTAVRALAPFLPLTVQAARAVAADEVVIPSDALDGDLTDVIEITADHTDTADEAPPDAPPDDGDTAAPAPADPPQDEGAGA